MAILLPAQKIAYFDTPKVASTSIKLALHQIASGETLHGREDLDVLAHRIYPTNRLAGPQEFAACRDYWKFAIVRDPVKRLLSAYSNRVVHHRDQYKDRFVRTRAALLGLSMDPDVNTFFQRLGRYRAQSGRIRHHTDRIAQYIGTDLSRFDAIYPIEKLDQFSADLAARTGQPVTLLRLQTGGPVITVDMLSRRTFDRLMAYLAPEYDLLHAYYTAPVYKGPLA
jgi:Sulfotransferase family